MSSDANMCFSLKKKNNNNKKIKKKKKKKKKYSIENSVYPDETARHEPSHLDLHCLHSIYFGLPD